MEDYCAFIDTALIRNRDHPICYNHFGCGAFVAQNANSDILFARNMDCECAIPMLLRRNDTSSYRFLSLVNMAFLDWDESTYDSLEIDRKLTLAAAYSPSDGINEYGFAENKYQVVTNFTLFDNPSKTGFGKDRYENILNILGKQEGIISEEDALELLKSNVIPGDEQWSAVYNLTKKTLSVTFCGDYENVHRFKL